MQWTRSARLLWQRPELSPTLPGSPTLVEAPPDPTMTTQTALDAWEKKSAAIQAKLERSRAAPAGSPASEAIHRARPSAPSSLVSSPLRV